MVTNMDMNELLKSRYSEHQHGDLPTIWVTYSVIKRLWFTLEDYEIHTHFAGGSIDLFIPAEYHFDLASVPRIAQWAIRPFDLSLVAPLAHDILYEFRGHHQGRRLTRKQSDQVFLDLMIRSGIPKLRRQIAYRAVRIGTPRSRARWGDSPKKANRKFLPMAKVARAIR